MIYLVVRYTYDDDAVIGYYHTREEADRFMEVLSEERNAYLKSRREYLKSIDVNFDDIPFIATSDYDLENAKVISSASNWKLDFLGSMARRHEVYQKHGLTRSNLFDKVKEHSGFNFTLTEEFVVPNMHKDASAKQEFVVSELNPGPNLNNEEID